MKIYKLKWASKFTTMPGTDLIIGQTLYSNIDAAIRDFEEIVNRPVTYGAYLLELSDDGYGRLGEVEELRHRGGYF